MKRFHGQHPSPGTTRPTNSGNLFSEHGEPGTPGYPRSGRGCGRLRWLCRWRGRREPQRIVTKSFLRYLPRRLSLSLLQLMGVACGVAAVVGMTMSAQTALSSFSKAVQFLRGNATHSMQRPAGPMEETTLAKLARDPAVEWFSPVIDRRLRLSNGDLVRFLAIDPFLDRIIGPRLQVPSLRETRPIRRRVSPSCSMTGRYW